MWYSSCSSIRRKARMVLSNEELLALMEAVENQGGVHRPDRHEPVRYQVPMESAAGVKRKVKIHTSGCYNESQFLVPYEHADGSVGTVAACAVCDNMLDWPRFAGVV